MENEERQAKALRRVERVQAAGWLSATALSFHCGVSETKMRDWIKLPSFPKPSRPTDGWKEARWEKAEVDAWLRVHRDE